MDLTNQRRERKVEEMIKKKKVIAIEKMTMMILKMIIKKTMKKILPKSFPIIYLNLSRGTLRYCHNTTMRDYLSNF